MNTGIKMWWKDLTPKERSGLLVLGAFLSGVIILYTGIKVGQIIAQIFNVL